MCKMSNENVTKTKLAEELNEEERVLVKQLKEEYCYDNGAEKNKKDCAEIFHKLALIYKQRSPDKIRLIQSATLLNAAITREPDNVEEIKEDLRKFCSDLLVCAKAQRSDADLVGHAAVVKSQVKNMRDKVLCELKKLDIIPKYATGDGLLRLEEKKIADIGKLQDEIAAEYKLIMNQLAVYCVSVMGDKPCKFTLAGMGSLARREITPYSDFENIIILEDGVQKREYFKWFAVIFQVILINLEETIIPSVAIPSLNDCTIQHGDWFFDAHTTRGVSFDGMMPHACKSPLGRQQKTKKKDWTTELIQPVSKMAEYLEKEQDLKNGYHLADILTKTCYVYGDRALYDEFKVLVQQKLESHDEDVKKELEKQIEEDLKSFNTRLSLANPNLGAKFNVKRVVYRSTTIFISGLGRMHKINASSCFDIVHELAQIGVISSDFEHKLRYAVALACEIRLKVYMEKKSQDDWVKGGSITEEENAFLIDTVGERSIFDYFQIAYSFQFDMCHYLGMNLYKFYFNPLSLIVSTCYFLKVYDKAISTAQYIIETPLVKNEIKYTDEPHINKFGPCFAQMQEENEKLENYKPQLTVQAQTATTKNHDVATSFQAIGVCLFKINKYEEALDYHYKTLSIYKLDTQGEMNNSEVAESYDNIGLCLRRMSKYDEARKYHDKSLDIRKRVSSDESSDKDLATSYNNIGLCLHDVNKYNDAQDNYEKSLKIRRRISEDENKDKDVAACLNNIGGCLRRINRYTEALDYHHQALNITRRISEDETSDGAVASAFNSIGLCLHRISRYNEALEYHRNSLEIRKRISVDEKSDKDICVSYNNIALSLRRINRYRESLEYNHKSLDIERLISPDENRDRGVASSYNNIALCLQDINKYEEAMEYHYKALAIKKSISIDEGSDRWVANSLNNVGRCLCYINRYKEALDYIEKAMNIREKISVDITSDRSLASSLDAMGFCLLGVHKLDEALAYFQRSFNIRKKISVDENADRDLAESLSNIGNCLHRMGMFHEALAKHEKSLKLRRGTAVDESSDRLVAKSLNNIGQCLHSMKKYKEAQEYYEEALDIRTKISVDVNLDRDMADSYGNIGLFLHDVNRYEEAMDYHKKSLNIRKQISVDPNSDRDMANCFNNTALCLLNLNRCDEALVYFMKSLDIYKNTGVCEDDKQVATVLRNIANCSSQTK